MVPMIHRARVSNGIKVMLELALNAKNKDIDTFVYPTFCGSFFKPNDIEPKYRKLNISEKIPEDCIAIIADTANPIDVIKVRNKAKRIVWYSLAIPGMFHQCNIPFIPRHPGEEEIVYSPQISQIFPQLYIQPKFKLIEEIVKNDPNLLERNFLKYAKKDSLFRSNKRHKIAFYQGKGSLTRSYSKNLKLIIKEADITLITRDYPSSKSALYSLIGTLDGLISLDPLSSLNYESTLLGTPVYVHSSWDESFVDRFPVSLAGIAFDDPEMFIYMLNNGFNSKSVFSSYKMALERNTTYIDKFFEWLYEFQDFEYDQQRALTTAYTNNLYWETRVKQNSIIAPLELNSQYNLSYLKSGGVWSRELFLKFVKKVIKRILSFPKSISKFLMRKINSISRYFLNLIMT